MMSSTHPEPQQPQSDTASQNDDVEEEQETVPQSSRRGGGPKRKSQKRLHPLQAKKSRELQQILKARLKFFPFRSSKPLNFTAHETLLKRLSLYEFVHLQFDQCVRTDLICEFIANWKSDKRCSYVKGVTIRVNRADLARALRLPVAGVKKENFTATAVKESEESVEILDQVMNNYVLLHDDMWMMPVEVLNWSNMIKDGNFERIDWAGIIWFMVSKELAQGSNLERCYYASHLQALIKNQKPELLNSSVEVEQNNEEEEEGSVRMEIVDDDDKEEDCGDDCGDGDDNVRASEDLCLEGSEMEEHNIELSLGGMDNNNNNNNVVREEGERVGKEEEEEEEEEMMMGDANSMDVEEKKEEDDHGDHWKKSSMDGHFLQRCDLGNVGIVECGEEEKQQDEIGDEDGKEGEDDDDEEEEEVDGHGEVGFSISPKGDALDGLSSENLMAAMEASQFPFTSGMQIHDNVPSSEFLASRADTLTIPGSSSHFGIANKRSITCLDSDVSHHSLSGGNKRMRNDAPWEMKATSDIDLCWEQMQHAMGKAKMLYEAKEQAVQEMNMNQQVWASQLQQRDEIIQHLHKTKLEEQQKRQSDLYRLERELQMMGSVLEGYRKALKATHRAFADYRARQPSPEQPIYKDAGPGGLVLSTTEFEKQRQKREEEERIQLLISGRKIKEFQTSFVTNFESLGEMVTSLDNKLLDVAKEVNILQKRSAKQKEMPAENTDENVSKPEP